MTRILITGAAGMLGNDLQRIFIDHDVTALGRSGLDITDADAVQTAVAGHDVVINAAAYTAVDQAETDEEAAFAINATGPLYLAIAARETGAKLIQVSTDYVFDGSATSPYPESTPHNPISAYGRTKAAGETAVLREHPAGAFIVRTAWLYGQHGPNFAKTMLSLAAKLDTLTVVDDQHGQPTWTLDLAQQIRLLLESDAPAGIYHGTNSGETTWRGFARQVFSLAGLDPDRVGPTDSASFVRPAPRPSYSVLGHDAWTAAGLQPMRLWTDALASAFADGAFSDVTTGAAEK
ncbi:dTDP-4-dehydrorhamnose reductase [Lysinibacter cavernae]|uniref:dTDP-4-dehydrorhamnose reductase n=1 Tax=Lysinibacter cavernae TaxID=1640652 RepID=A0A7X5R3U4_9MICO|nr:dTDP-4-dehydrorhamnose reductase [Lysinibacter cavernae]NIH55111.1 dTDP-4-dehydrorhamnose reductase [Lysinibacter cavernae]